MKAAANLRLMGVNEEHESLLVPPKRPYAIDTAIKSPRPHQREAISKLVKALQRPGADVRVQAHMACGSGKTLVGLWVSQKLGSRTMLCEPNLALVAQNLKEWRVNASGERPDILVVCSDRSTVNINQD
jgi:predicted helicase